jgi:CRP/FNR family transcriptional regulator, nitrogen oxide reductase regulator
MSFRDLDGKVGHLAILRYDSDHKGREVQIVAGMESLRGFRTLSAVERDMIAAATRERSVAAGQVLFSEGEPAEALWAVKDGLVHIIKFGPEGREIVLEVMPPGELFGAVAALQSRPYPASAVAGEPSHVWSLPASLARDLCQKYPALRSAILDQVTGRLRDAHDRLRSVALERVEQRLARMLLTLADKIGQPQGQTTELSITRQELADMIGSTVETVIRITSKWQQSGVISCSRNRVVLGERDSLARIIHRS